MTIHHIINELPFDMGGAEKIISLLHEGLLEKKISSRLVSLAGVSSLGAKTPYSIESFMNVYSYIKNNCKMDDIIHAHLFPTMLYVSLAVRMLRWRGNVVCTEHSTHNRRRGSFFGKIIDWQTYRGYKKIFCISSATRDALQDWMPSMADKCLVIENGAELPFDTFTPRENHRKLIIASVGRLHKIKNYETALKALASLDDLDFEYHIAGTGVEEKHLRETSIQLGLKDKVKFRGYVEDIASFLQQADVFIITSRWEGFGLAAVEAMNAGLPVIASDVPGLSEITDSEPKCSIMVSPEKPAEITDAVMQLLDRDRRIELGKSAFERSLLFSKERMIDSYIAEYKKIFSQPLC
ncbi:MAG: glycosyltransferase family 4 protein [Kiritimatiellae bacterium]|nr:glycosyltransferase family 4 protein [Kiritimatiellia bacterium]